MSGVNLERLSAREGLDAEIEAVEDRLFQRCRIVGITRILRPTPAQRLRVHEHGAGEAVILLHGLTFFGAYWAPMLRHLGVRALAPDLPGYGLSDAIDYQSADLRRWAVEWFGRVLDALELPRAAVAGNSFGGMMALWLAAELPDRVSRIALIGTPGTALPGLAPDSGLALLAAPKSRIAHDRTLGRSTVESYLQRALGPRAFGHVPPELIDLYQIMSRRPGWRGATRSLLDRLFAEEQPRPELVLDAAALKRIKVPVLLLWGTPNEYHGAALSRQASALLPGAEFLAWHGAGEFPHYDDPEGFGRVLTDFVRGRPPGAPGDSALPRG